MMEVQQAGRTPEEAVGEALRELRIAREYVLVETLTAGTKGFLGVGGREARVRVTVTPSGQRLIRGRALLERVLSLMGFETQVRAEEREGQVHLEVSGERAGLLIGKEGQTLEALQGLVARILARQLGESTRAHIDVEGYRERRRQHLEGMALGLASQVKATGRAAVIEPMTPAERRIVHLVLKEDAGVRTGSVGDGPRRRVIISPTNLRHPG